MKDVEANPDFRTVGKDYNDPMTFLDLWTSNSLHNESGWKNTEFDRQINIGKISGGRKERMEAPHKAEGLFMKDYPIAPVYYYSDVYIVKDCLKGYYGSPLGFKYFMYCTVDK